MCNGGYQMADGRTGTGGWGGMMTQTAKDDAFRVARGEPAQNFKDIKPNYSNPEVQAAQAQAPRTTQTGSATPTRQARRGVDK